MFAFHRAQLRCDGLTLNDRVEIALVEKEENLGDGPDGQQCPKPWRSDRNDQTIEEDALEQPENGQRNNGGDEENQKKGTDGEESTGTVDFQETVEERSSDKRNFSRHLPKCGVDLEAASERNDARR